MLTCMASGEKEIMANVREYSTTLIAPYEDMHMLKLVQSSTVPSLVVKRQNNVLKMLVIVVSRKCYSNSCK